jgi:uncharacterized membrane protein
MSLETRQSWDFGFWMALLALGGVMIILWGGYKLLILPLLVIFLIITWLMVVNNKIAVREIKAKEHTTQNASRSHDVVKD